MGDRIDPGDVLADEGARLGGLLVRGLALPEGLSVDQHDREMAGARAAVSGLAGEVWDTEGRGIVERIQAAQFVSAHAAAMDWQAEANRRDLPTHARQTCQRIARQLMALTTSQLNGLCRLKAERRKERAEAARAAEQARRRAERDTDERFKAGAADVKAMIAGFERTGRELARADRAALKAAREGGLDGDLAGAFEDGFEEGFAETAGFARAMDAAGPSPAPGSAPGFADTPRCRSDDAGGCADLPSPACGPKPSADRPKRAASAEAAASAAEAGSFSFAQAGASASPKSAGPRPLGAGVPEPPDDLAPPLNRRQRRALARLRRKERVK